MEDKELFFYIQQQEKKEEEGWAEKLIESLNLQEVTKMVEIKKIVTEKEIKEIDREIEKIYNVEYANNYSIAYNLGFNTISNLNGSGYENLIRIINNLNYGGEEDEYFTRFILGKVLDNHKIEILKKELLENRNRYVRFLNL